MTNMGIEDSTKANILNSLNNDMDLHTTNLILWIRLDLLSSVGGLLIGQY